MAVRGVVVVNHIEEAFLKIDGETICPYCAAKDSTRERAKRRTVGEGSTATQEIIKPVSHKPWLDTHLERCKRKQACIEAGEILKVGKYRSALHDECGRCMILEVRDGLALIENESRRYVVAAADLTVGCVSQILQYIDQRDLSEEMTRELISHLMAKGKQTRSQIKPRYRRGMIVEFQMGDTFKAGKLLRRHGLHCWIVELTPAPTDGEAQRLTISHENVTRIVE